MCQMGRDEFPRIFRKDSRAWGHPMMFSAALSNLAAQIMITQLSARGGHSAEIIMRGSYGQDSFYSLYVPNESIS